MALSPRVRRLERTIAPDPEGYRSCRLCDNGARRRLVVHMVGDEKPPPAPLCPSCGRDTTFWVNITAAEVPPRLETPSA